MAQLCAGTQSKLTVTLENMLSTQCSDFYCLCYTSSSSSTGGGKRFVVSAYALEGKHRLGGASDTFGQATSGSGSGFTSSNGWMVSPQSV
jgi:hypothetical protein